MPPTLTRVSLPEISRDDVRVEITISRLSVEPCFARVLVLELWPGDVVIMDSLASRKASAVQDAIEANYASPLCKAGGDLIDSFTTTEHANAFAIAGCVPE